MSQLLRASSFSYIFSIRFTLNTGVLWPTHSKIYIYAVHRIEFIVRHHHNKQNDKLFVVDKPNSTNQGW